MTDLATGTEIADVVQIEPHGVSGLTGRPAGEMRRVLRDAFEEAFWLPGQADAVDQHVAFLGQLELAAESEVTIRIQASGAFRLRIDGEIAVVGPLRFAPSLPEFNVTQHRLTKGRHTLAVHAHGQGLTTRMAAALPNFVWVEVSDGEAIVPVSWTGRVLSEYRATGLRVSPLLGWVEWQEAPSPDPTWWDGESRAEWGAVEVVAELRSLLGRATPSDVSIGSWVCTPVVPIARGRYRDTYVGYEFDDIGTQFLLADDEPDLSDDLDGAWWRYDLGRVRIGSLEFTIDSDEAAEVTLAYAERLTPSGRPSPMVALSAGSTRMLQHFAVARGRTRIEPLQSLGGRYLEIRVRSKGRAVVSSEQFRERDLLGPATAAFTSPDPVLETIWRIGAETLRASAEDSLVDSVRERGEWVGDVSSSALHILQAGWGDTRLVRRALLHAAASARQDGLVAGCGPGELLYLGTYAAQWVTACVEVAVAEGDVGLLIELEEPARANVEALASGLSADGTHSLPWPFVDWGYGAPQHQPDLAVLIHIHHALTSWITWQSLLGRNAELDRWEAERERLGKVISRWLPTAANRYHSTALAAMAGLVRPAEVAGGILDHIRHAFPFDRTADRLRDPTQVKPGAVTPYFTNYSMAVLLRAGLGAEVAELWRSGWGWMIDRGATTWWEVFDERWSQCHSWSGAPTWQLSRFGLGLHPRLDADGSFVTLRLNTLDLGSAAGRVNLPRAAKAEVQWRRRDDVTVDYSLTLDSPLVVDRGGDRTRLSPGTHHLVLRRDSAGDRYS